MKNKILKLFNEEYVIDLFKKEVLHLYPDFCDIKKIIIKAPKKYIWEKTYHVVAEFRTSFVTKDKRIVKIPIYCSAHSDEPRKNVYTALKFLWDHGFGKSFLTIPRPLFYSEYFCGIFYRGAEGHNLYEFIRTENYGEIEKTIPLAAKWFAKLHNTSIKDAINFNKENSRLKTVIPGEKHILETVKRNYSKHYDFYKKAYEIFINNEEVFLASTNQRWLIHGDAHPENIIKISKKKIAVIDFTDLCLSDVARDLGTFIEQLDFMMMRKINNKKYSEKMKNIFLENYFKNAKIELDDNLQKRIDNYLNWTKVRTATFFLLKDNAEPERALPLIRQVKKNLNI